VSLGCAGCGDCCNPVKIEFATWANAVGQARAYQPDEIDLSDPEDRSNWADCVFVAASLRPVGAEGHQVYLKCANYDSDHQSCRAYGKRPPLCRRFPWYDREPDGGIVDLRCSYLLDIAPDQRPEGARPLIPITPV
jgi:Fe-S-cluster containining protein